MQITFENLLVITLSLGLVYYIISRTESNKASGGAGKSKDLPAVDMTPLDQIPELVAVEEPIKPKIDNVSDGNLREGFLFWRQPEAPVHDNLLSIHTTNGSQHGDLYH